MHGSTHEPMVQLQAIQQIRYLCRHNVGNQVEQRILQANFLWFYSAD